MQIKKCCNCDASVIDAVQDLCAHCLAIELIGARKELFDTKMLEKISGEDFRLCILSSEYLIVHKLMPIVLDAIIDNPGLVGEYVKPKYSLMVGKMMHGGWDE